MVNDTPTEVPKTLNKDELYRMRHPERIRATYAKHYAENREKINEKRREKRRLFKEAVTRGFDQHNKTQYQPCVESSRDVPCTVAAAQGRHVD